MDSNSIYLIVDFVDFVGHMEVHRPLTGDPLQDGFSLTGVNVPRLSYRTILPAAYLDMYIFNAMQLKIYIMAGY